MDNEVVPPPALNEIFCTRVNMARTPIFSIGMMNDEIRQRMDGILISTPTGSTGHSLSFGSAILHEDLDCLILVPVASVNRMPPVVVPVQEIEIKCNHNLYLIVDGQEMFNVDTGKPVKISRYQSNAKFIRIKKRGMRQLAKLGF
jgi:NAD+ kinase